MKKIILIAGLVAVVLIAVLAVRVSNQRERIKDLQTEVEKQKSNVSVLMAQLDTFKVNDSLNACRSMALQMTLNQLALFHRQDLETIKELKGKNRDLSRFAEMQTKTIDELKETPVRDTIIQRDTISLRVQKIDYKSKWFDFKGQIINNRISGKFEARDSLVLYETVRFKRFLGFLWKTSRLKDRDITVVSKNPNTRILGCELVVIEE